MDFLAHGLWSYAIFNKKKYAWLAVLFGLMPDILSFGILFVTNLLKNNFHKGPPPLSTLPKWVFSAYNLTHSIVMFIFVFILIYLITKKWFLPLTTWAIHILVDIPTHTTKFFPTPFLWPISNYRFNGISWGMPWFMVVNYTALLVVFILIARSRAKEKRRK